MEIVLINPTKKRIQVSEKAGNVPARWAINYREDILMTFEG